MAQKPSRTKLAAHSLFDRARAQQLEERGYISCRTAMATATEMLDKGEPEVALMFCDLARELLGKSAAHVSQMVGMGNRQTLTA
jgi:hypothetical protein